MEIELFDDTEPAPRFFLFDRNVLINKNKQPNYPQILSPLFEMFKKMDVKFRILSDHQVEEENDPLTAITKDFVDNNGSVKKNLRKSIALTVAQIENQTMINIDNKFTSIAQKSLSHLRDKPNEKPEDGDVRIGQMKIKLDKNARHWNNLSENRIVIFSLLTALDQAKLTPQLTDKIKKLGIVHIETPPTYKQIKLEEIIYINKNFDANNILKTIGITVYESNLISFSKKLKEMLTKDQYKRFTLNCNRFDFIEEISKEMQRINDTHYFFEDLVLKQNKLDALDRFMVRVKQNPGLSPEHLINQWQLGPKGTDTVKGHTVREDMETLANHRRPFLRIILNLLPVKTSSIGLFKARNENRENNHAHEPGVAPKSWFF